MVSFVTMPKAAVRIAAEIKAATRPYLAVATADSSARKRNTGTRITGSLIERSLALEIVRETPRTGGP
jgi:hypothetical protein